MNLRSQPLGLHSLLSHPPGSAFTHVGGSKDLMSDQAPCCRMDTLRHLFKLHNNCDASCASQTACPHRSVGQ